MKNVEVYKFRKFNDFMTFPFLYFLGFSLKKIQQHFPSTRVNDQHDVFPHTLTETTAAENVGLLPF